MDIFNLKRGPSSSVWMVLFAFNLHLFPGQSFNPSCSPSPWRQPCLPIHMVVLLQLTVSLRLLSQPCKSVQHPEALIGRKLRRSEANETHESSSPQAAHPSALRRRRDIALWLDEAEQMSLWSKPADSDQTEAETCSTIRVTRMCRNERNEPL